MNMNLEMFSRGEMIAFGLAMVAFVLLVIVLYIVVELLIKLEQKRIRRLRLQLRLQGKPTIDTWNVNEDDFNTLVDDCRARQSMKSIIAETALGDIEIKKENK